MKMRHILAGASAVMLALLCTVPTPPPVNAIGSAVYFNEFDAAVNGGEPIRGVDISSILAVEDAGVVLYDAYGNEQDIFRTLAEHGVNYIRVRVWNSPYDSAGNSYGGGNCDVYTAAEIGRRAAEYGMKLLVDFHYSDFWADPEKQSVPKAWTDYSLEWKKTAIWNFTTESLQIIRDAGADIGMVQVGNETNCFFCGETDIYNICAMFSSGCKAVRDFDPNILIALHFANPSTGYYDWYAEMLDDCWVDYDVFATSYYPYWHGTTENMTAVLKKIADTYGKYVMVAETAYPYTSEDGDSFGNAVSEGSSGCEFRYEISVEGQAQCLSDVFQAVANVGSKGIGAFYWEPAWIGKAGLSWAEQSQLWETYGSGWATAAAGEYDASATAAGGSSYDNQALFDFNGRPLPSLSVFNQIYPQHAPDFEPEVTVLDGAYRIRNLHSGLYMTVANAEETAGANVVQYAADGADAANTWHIRNLEGGWCEIYSALGDGTTYLLDLDYGKTDNRTNIGIFTNTDADAQKFRLIANDDGSYYIVTKSTGGKSAIEMEDGKAENAGNVQQFEVNGHACQKWLLEPVEAFYRTGDLNADGRVNAFDLCILKRQMLQQQPHGAGDVNADGDVTIADIIHLQKHLLGMEPFDMQEHGTPKNTIFPKV